VVKALAPVIVVLALAAAASAGGAPGERRQACEPGVHSLRLGIERPGRMRVTPGGTGGRKALVVVLHGAGGSADDGLRAFSTWNARGLVLVAPASKGVTWSALRGSDVDLTTVNAALARAYARCRIDRTRIAVGGFSDGGTYALALGLASGDLFRSVAAFSPGGIVGGGQTGRPRFFVSHGTRDPVLPIGRTSNAIVRQLRTAGYPVTYRRFAGGHVVPRNIGKAAQRWFLAG
jgi:phospholipase/carboxylesterase